MKLDGSSDPALLPEGRNAANPNMETHNVSALQALVAQRAGFLQQLDVFVSPSLWEGCNLPLMEAQAMGVPALAFDTGAHPEVCAYVCGSIDEMLRLTHCWQQQPELRRHAAVRAANLMQQRFGWDRATAALLAAVL